MRLDKQRSIKPQDILILLKIIALNDDEWQQKPLAKSLRMSQSEISQSVARSVYAGLLDHSGKKVIRQRLMAILECGLAYIFPVRPGSVVRGVPTAHSAAPLNDEILSMEPYVWPYAYGQMQGMSITPLYPTVPEAALKDQKLHVLLALSDAIRVGRTREKRMAIDLLKPRIL